MKNKAFRYKLEAAGALLPLGLFKLLGLEASSAFSGWLCRTIGPRVGATRRARKNIEMAFPDMSTGEVDQIIRDMWDNIGRTIAEYAHLDKFREPAHRARVSVRGMDQLLAIKDRGALLVSGHFANWELMPLAVHMNGLKGGEVYRHANNPAINNWITKLRTRAIFPVQIPKGPKGARDLIRVVRQHGFICMLVDQKMNDGIEATLFGRKAMSPSASGTMATRYGIPIVPVSMKRVGGVHFEQVFHAPIEVNMDADPKLETARITQALNDFLEAEIRANPSQWLWLHNRWPKDA